ncbi:MAG: hypothetical protein ACRDY2_01830 [Acidimicrobiales bacterium]
MRGPFLGALALAVVVALTAAGQAPATNATLASTTVPPVPTGAAAKLPSSAPAPPGFAQSLVTAYSQADSVVAPTSATGSSSKPPLPSSGAFAQQVNSLTPAELNAMYDANTGAWSKVFSATASYAAANVGRFIPSTLPTQVPNVTPTSGSTTTTTTGSTTTTTTTPPSTTTTTLPPPTTTTTTGRTRTGHTVSVGPVQAPGVATGIIPPIYLVSDVTGPPDPVPSPATPSGPPSIFTPVSCAISSSFPGSAGFQTIYALTVAEQAVQAVGYELSQAADIDFTVAEAGVPIEEQVELGLGIGLLVASGVDSVLAAALQVSVDTINYLVNRSQDCAGNNQQSTVGNIDSNVVDTANNANAIYALDQSNYSLDQQIYALLDTRTTHVINQLDVAQKSLDQALYHSIEEALVGGTPTAIVSYELPASLGGYLDSTTIGVQAIVTATLSSMQTANQSFSRAATTDLVKANRELAAKQYKAAFADYQTTYQLLVH